MILSSLHSTLTHQSHLTAQFHSEECTIVYSRELPNSKQYCSVVSTRTTQPWFKPDETCPRHLLSEELVPGTKGSYVDMGKQVSNHNHFVCADVLTISQDQIHLGALEYTPHAVMKLLKNIPYHW